MRHKFLAVVVLAIAAPACLAEITLTRGADGFFTATTPNYSARVGPDGNLHSLISDGTEFLLDGYKGLVGGGYLTITEGPEWSVEVFRFGQVEQAGPDAVVATADKHRLIYKFLPDAIELSFAHTAPPTVYHFVLNPALKDMLEKNSGETIAPKTVWREGVPMLFNERGANVTFPAGVLYYIAKNARDKPDTDPEVLQVWMPQTWQDNVITQRLIIHAKPTVADTLQATLAVSPANHLFPGGRPAELALVGKTRVPGLECDAQAELIATDFLTKREVFRETRPLRIAALAAGEVRFTLTPPPGFYEGVLTVKQGEETLATRTFPFAYDLAHMLPPERPADFDQFWDDTLAEQDKIPPDWQLALEKETADYRLYRTVFTGLFGRKFHAWLSVPVREGKYPGTLTLPPSGINVAYLPSLGPGIVGMSLAIAGQELTPPPDGKFPPDPYFRLGWDYFRTGIDSRETWYYRAVYAACSRAVDLLASRPETDVTRIFVSGGSQGGGLAFITAALNPKVTMAVGNSPGLFGLEWKLRHLGPAYWPPIDPVDENSQPITDPDLLEKRVAVVRYGDGANFAPRLKCAVLLNLGLQDHVTSPVGALASWSRLEDASVRAILADSWGGHNGPRGGQALTSAWLAALVDGQVSRVLDLRPADSLPVLVEARR